MSTQNIRASRDMHHTVELITGGGDVTTEAIAQIAHECETWCNEQDRSKISLEERSGWVFNYSEAWHIHYIGSPPQTHQRKCYILNVVEATTG